MSSQFQIPATCRAYNIVELVKISAPSPPGPDDVLVKVHAVSLNFRDLLISKGVYSNHALPENLIPTSDAACEIVAVGANAKDWTVGQRVFASFFPEHLDGVATAASRASAFGAEKPGVLVEYRTLAANYLFDTQSIVEIPDHLSWEKAATLPCAGLTAYSALLGPQPIKGGDHVLVLGTGGVSMFALQFAVASGAVVFATSSSDNKLEIASKLGAKHVINYNKTPDWHGEVLRITNGRGVDHVLEVGGAGTLGKSLSSVKISGSVHIIGIVSMSNSPPATLIPQMIGSAANMRGILVGSVAQSRDMVRLISAQKIKPLVDRVFDFEQAVEAYQYLEDQKHVGKVVIKVSKD
ncbi:NAD(P)-binding protein [Pterulicium gracile]|uniref:NAD(P)-binding protein n=1 Tax=Pterulicium gracile TaxID=1884261 RepID=A0A5C3QKZ4_9AGAR|nr:NAD(P)-binding protein [Pterula gracilis]